MAGGRVPARAQSTLVNHAEYNSIDKDVHRAVLRNPYDLACR